MKRFSVLFLSVAFVFMLGGTTFAGLNDGLVAYYPFNGNANDESGKGNHGIVYDAILTSDRFDSDDSAYSFSRDDYIGLPSAETILGENPDSWSYSVWFKLDEYYREWQTIISDYYSNSGDTLYGIRFELQASSKKLQLAITDGVNGYVLFSNEIINVDTWYHAAAVISKQDSTMKLYINGEYDNEMTINSTIDYIENVPISIGRVFYNGQTYSGFYGSIDDIYIYNRALTDDEINDLYNFQPAEKIPVLIVPGIMGSFSSCLFNPNCCNPDACSDPQCLTYWNPNGLININLNCDWILDPIHIKKIVWLPQPPPNPPIPIPILRNPTYQSLIDAFIDAGYEEGVTLFPAPYDWRNRNQDSASEFLDQRIQEAKNISGHPKVDVVSHSMGGLVTRWYVEGMDRSDIRKFIMLGTPNHGSATAYYAWEGGDFSTYSSVETSIFINPLIEDMKVGYGYGGVSDREFIQAMIPSVLQLTPVYNYIYNIDTMSVVPESAMFWQNDLVPYLNYERLLANIGIENITIGAGVGEDTLYAIKVNNPPGGDDWIDGIPVEIPPTDKRQFRTAGDDTVLVPSASLGDISLRRKNCKHGDLTDCFKNEVVAFIGDTSAASLEQDDKSVSDTATMVPPESILFIGTRDAVRMSLITSDGRKVGWLPQQSGKTANIDRYYYRGNDKQTAAIGIYDVQQNGASLLVWTDNPNQSYEIAIVYKAKGLERKMTKVKGTASQGQVLRHQIKFVGNRLMAD